MTGISCAREMSAYTANPRYNEVNGTAKILYISDHPSEGKKIQLEMCYIFKKVKTHYIERITPSLRHKKAAMKNVTYFCDKTISVSKQE